ncbi:MAG: transglycosylase SLT domain-containing protein [Bacteroidales bacterium]|jgi:membrane-bound lytic murein transglycosylase D|nr:transglycosylase SLT domain-containing protein [Bacteroidales bacterium]
MTVKNKNFFAVFIVLLFSITLSSAQETCCDSVETDEFIEDLLSVEMDSMLHELSDATLSTYDVLEEFSDQVLAERFSNILTTVPLAYNQKVKKWVELYCKKITKTSAAVLGRTQYYYPYMYEIFDKYNLPEELVYLTIIESALNPNAVSRAGATGIWQFMYRTGKAYGLEVNTFIDDRRDPFKATDAAARHLRDLYNSFHDWGLVISAYNGGQGNVRKAISRCGCKDNPDYWKVAPFLPRETQSYYPAFLGALYMMNYHTTHGIEPDSVSIPLDVDTVMVNKELHLGQVAAVLNVSMDELRLLNPQYKKDVIPAYKHTFPLRLKAADLDAFITLSDSIYKYQYDDFLATYKVYEYIYTGITDSNYTIKNIYHTVRKGESIAAIARKHDLSVAELKEMNHLKGNSLKQDQRLLVGFQSIKKGNTTSVSNGTNNTPIVQNDSSSSHQNSASATYYMVKKGDTLGVIAQKYHTTVQKIMTDNQIKNANALKIGQKLTIYGK